MSKVILNPNSRSLPFYGLKMLSSSPYGTIYRWVYKGKVLYPVFYAGNKIIFVSFKEAKEFVEKRKNNDISCGSSKDINK